ncbi:MAG: hypothetical protein ACRDP4_05625 [Nocardioidaceae bacterium]
MCEHRSASELLPRWSDTETALEGFADLEALAAAVWRGPKPRSDLMLAALIRLAQDGEEAAAIIVLHVMTPKIEAMARRVRPDSIHLCGLDQADIIRVLQAAMYEEVAHLPVQRIRHSVASHLALNTLHAVTLTARDKAKTPGSDSDRKLRFVSRSAETQHMWQSGVGFAAAGSTTRVARLDGRPTTSEVSELPLEPGTRPSRQNELLEMLAWAVRTAVIKRADATLLYETYLHADAGTRAHRRTIPLKMGVAASTARKRRERAIRALAEAVAPDSFERAEAS